MNIINPENTTKEQVRSLFPECVRAANDFRDVFGPGIRLVFAREGNNEIGELIEPEKSIALSQMIINPPPNEDSDGG